MINRKFRMKTRIITYSQIGVLLLLFSACRPARDDHFHKEDTEKPASIDLSIKSQEIIGLKTEVAVRREYLIPLRAAGQILFNPRNYAIVVARCPGRVEEVLVYEDEPVKKGQVLLRLYSPEHQALLAEYLESLERLDRQSGHDRDLAEKLLISVHRRLRLLGINEEEIRNLAQTRSPEEFLAIRSPLEGRIISRSVNNGEYVETGQEFFRVADLSLLWVEINVFEKDLTRLAIPGDCEIRVGAYPDRIFKGRVNLLSEVMDEATRTFRLRAEVRNPDFLLKPGMYADVYLWPRKKERILAIPEKAVRRLEGEDVLFVLTGPESFSLRSVRLGRFFDGLVEIIEGLEEGETYVTEGSFILKSEFLKKILEGEGHEHKH